MRGRIFSSCASLFTLDSQQLIFILASFIPIFFFFTPHLRTFLTSTPILTASTIWIFTFSVHFLRSVFLYFHLYTDVPFFLRAPLLFLTTFLQRFPTLCHPLWLDSYNNDISQALNSGWSDLISLAEWVCLSPVPVNAAPLRLRRLYPLGFTTCEHNAIF